MVSKVPRNYLGSNAVMFGDSGCPACLGQMKLLMDQFGKNTHVIYYDLSRYPAPEFIKHRNGDVSMPTWVLPSGKVHRGVITKNLKSLLKTRSSSFGECVPGDGTIPQINSLAECGKNFPGGQGNIIPNSFMQDIQNKWGEDYLNAGIGGFRSLGPDSNDVYYSNNNWNNIRMEPPGGQMDTAYGLNRRCNILKNNIGDSTYGLVYDTPGSPQIVGFGNRGRGKKNRFGQYLYRQMGGAYANQPLVNANTVQQLHGGAIQNNIIRPRLVQNPTEYIGQVKAYNPSTEDITNFGKKKRTLGEGSILSLTRKNKIKVSS